MGFLVGLGARYDENVFIEAPKNQTSRFSVVAMPH